MARARWTKSSRVPHTCGRGGHEIPKGEGYYSASPGYHGRTQYRCQSHPFRPSELTTSMRSQPLAALEALQDEFEAATTVEELESAWENFSSEVRSYADEREYALDAWENGNSQLEELRDTAEEAASTIEDHYFEEFDEEAPEEGDYADPGEFESALADWTERHDEHFEQQRQDALDVAESVEF